MTIIISSYILYSIRSSRYRGSGQLRYVFVQLLTENEWSTGLGIHTKNPYNERSVVLQKKNKDVITNKGVMDAD